MFQEVRLQPGNMKNLSLISALIYSVILVTLITFGTTVFGLGKASNSH